MRATHAQLRALVHEQKRLQELQVRRFVAATQQWDAVMGLQEEALRGAPPAPAPETPEAAAKGPAPAPRAAEGAAEAAGPAKPRSRHKHGYIRTTRKNFELLKAGKLNLGQLGFGGRLGGVSLRGGLAPRNKTKQASFWDLVKQAREEVEQQEQAQAQAQGGAGAPGAAV